MRSPARLSVIVLVVLECKPHGGQDQYVFELARNLARLGYDVHVVTSVAEGLEDVPVTVHRVPLPDMPNLARFAAFYALASSVVRSLRGPTTVVHATGGNVHGADVITTHFCHPTELRSIRTRPGAWSARGLYHQAVQALGWGLDVLEMRNRRAPRIVAVSESTKQDVVRGYRLDPSSVDVITSGVNPERFNPEVRRGRAQARCEFDLPSDAPVFLFVGAFARKGLDTLIRALAATTRDDSMLLVVGAGDVEPFVDLARRQGVAGRIRWGGYQPRIERLYGAADVFVFPTRYEPFGLVVAEAMACGLPAITTRVAGVSELLTDGVDSFILDDPEDVSALAVAMDRSLMHERLSTMSSAAATTMLAHTWALVAERYESVYRRVIERRKGASR
jgi:glycosyltransferase involved in cell wall biosynthesis